MGFGWDGFWVVGLLLFGLTSYVLSVWVRMLWNFLVWEMLLVVLVVAGGFVVVCEFGCFWVFWLSGSCSFCDLRCVLVWVVLGCLLTVCLQVGFCWFVCGSGLLRVVVAWLIVVCVGLV